MFSGWEVLPVGVWSIEFLDHQRENFSSFQIAKVSHGMLWRKGRADGFSVCPLLGFCSLKGKCKCLDEKMTVERMRNCSVNQFPGVR